MKYEDCPNCDGKLGVPDKLRGQPVECPVCKLSFVPPVKPRPNQPAKPALRSLPFPAAISAVQEEPELHGHSSDAVMPPKQRLSTMAPESTSRSSAKNTNTKTKLTVSKTRSSERSKAPLVSDLKSTGSRSPRPHPDTLLTNVKTPLGKDIDESKKDSTLAQTDSPASRSSAIRPKKNQSGQPKQRAVARIIKSELVQPHLTKDGKLPTLNLVDDAQPKESDDDLKRNPVVIALLICFSLVSSGLMIFLVGMQPSLSEKRVAESREEIQKFHEVKFNDELQDYQRELREAQLAHSRQDYNTEISCYGKIMSRFHSEDRNKFSGLTGSPTWDNELEEHVSVLLNDAKQRLQGF
ncbi:MAG: hypothetical protein ACI87E_005067 [Mariniblastus sp.]|jgi:hypothetical protein